MCSVTSVAKSSSHLVLVALLLLTSIPAHAAPPDRDTKVRNDRTEKQADGYWVYNDLPAGLAAARQQNKPLLVVLRCIPCEACAGFDEQVSRRDPIVARLLDQFVCVRIIQCNALDLARFQFDYDMSFAAFLMHADGTIYGRFGSMSNHDDAQREVTVEGLAAAMTQCLAWYSDHDRLRAQFAAKEGSAPRYAVPEQYSTLSKYQAQLDYQGKVASSCIHCHQVRDAERTERRVKGEAMTDDVLYPYPMPDFVGLALDPKQMATVREVIVGSAAEQAGFLAGDELVSLAGQPLLSIADVQWVLHTAAAPGTLRARVRRQGREIELMLPLAKEWRRAIDISWRATTWDLRRMAFGGMWLVELPSADRQAAKIDERSVALLVKHVGEHGAHALAKKAGVRKGDVIVEIEGRRVRISESQWITDVLRRTRPGDSIPIVVRRNEELVKIALTAQ